MWQQLVQNQNCAALMPSMEMHSNWHCNARTGSDLDSFHGFHLHEQKQTISNGSQKCNCAHNSTFSKKIANLFNSSMLRFLGIRCVENGSKVASSFGISAENCNFQEIIFKISGIFNHDLWKISILWWLKTTLWLRLLRWPPKELPQCLILHQEQASFQLQRTAPVFKSSLSMILSAPCPVLWLSRPES